MEASSPPKILIVDDHAENLDLLEAVLAAPDLKILKALSGEEALRYLLPEEVAVVLLDIWMPNMDGFETARIIRESKKIADVPIIFLTALAGDMASVFTGYQAGAVDYIVKPFEPSILKAKVGVFVDLFRRRQELAYSKKRLSETNERLKIHTDLLQEANTKLAAEVEMHKKARQEITFLHAELERRSHDAIQKLNDDLTFKNAKLEELNRELESFIYSVSHDLRQPLRAMATFAQMALKNWEMQNAKRGYDYLSRIINNTSKMAKITDALLHLSQLARGEPKTNRVNLSDMASAIVSRLHDGSPERCVDVQIEAGLTAVIDQDMAEILLTNLIENAWKFTSRTENARIEVGAEYEDGRIIYFVRDSGIGFNQEFEKKMFQPFQRLVAADEYEGTGIGLSIVQRIINRHGGKVWAQCGKPGSGTTIYFTLPDPENCPPAP